MASVATGIMKIDEDPILEASLAAQGLEAALEPPGDGPLEYPIG